jgi:anti-anti-sigma factor
MVAFDVALPVSSSRVVAGGRNSAPLVSGDGQRTVVWLDGEHDVATLSVLADILRRATSSDDADVVVDLSGVTFFSAATLGELVTGRNALRRLSRSLMVRSPSKCARRVIDACGLTGLVEGGSPGAVQAG